MFTEILEPCAGLRVTCLQFLMILPDEKKMCL
jgi:hypothetical protein